MDIENEEIKKAIRFGKAVERNRAILSNFTVRVEEIIIITVRDDERESIQYWKKDGTPICVVDKESSYTLALREPLWTQPRSK